MWKFLQITRLPVNIFQSSCTLLWTPKHKTGSQSEQKMLSTLFQKSTRLKLEYSNTTESSAVVRSEKLLHVTFKWVMIFLELYLRFFKWKQFCWKYNIFFDNAGFLWHLNFYRESVCLEVLYQRLHWAESPPSLSFKIEWELDISTLLQSW